MSRQRQPLRAECLEARITPVGELDLSFGPGGFRATDIGGSNRSDVAEEILIQDDGRIILVGTANLEVGGTRPAFVRYNADGTLDTSYGNDGIVVDPIGFNSVRAAALQDDGKIIFTAPIPGPGTLDFGLARYNNDGTRDTTFGSNGLVRTDVAGSQRDTPTDIHVLDDGKILVVGVTQPDDGTNQPQAALARYMPDGRLDTDFGSGGIAVTSFVDPLTIRSVAVNPSDGSIYLVGHMPVPFNGDDFALLRFTSAGVLDDDFGTLGLVTTDVAFNDRAESVTVLADGKVLLSGTAGGNPTLIRFDADGALDADFGTDGVVVTDLRAEMNFFTIAADLAIQADGKIIFAGTADRFGFNDDFLVIRYNADGSRDAVFGTDGVARTDFFNRRDELRAVAIDPRGGILVAGATVVSGFFATDFVVARHVAGRPPVANDDSPPAVDEDSPRFAIDVLANDIDPDTGDNSSLTIVAVDTIGTSGVVEIAEDGRSVFYTPAPDFFGTDTFTYTVRDAIGGTGTATVTVTLNPVPDAPRPADDEFDVDEGTPPVVLDVLANDIDPDAPGNSRLVIVAFDAAGVVGTVELAADRRSLVYTPPAKFGGVETFTYTVTNDSGLRATATVRLTVNPVNNPPVARDTNVVTPEDTAVIIDVLANDFDPDTGDNSGLRIATVTQPANGTVTILTDRRSVRYVPAPNYFGTDTFTYTISDGEFLATANVTVTVTPVNDPPVAVADAVTVSQGGVAAVIDVLANDFDPDTGDNSVLTIVSVTQPVGGSVAILPGGRAVSYTPAPGFLGRDTFTYTVTDDEGATATATVVVTVVPNSPPVANDDVFVIDQDSGPVALPVLANDRDPDGDPIVIASVTQPSNGSVTIAPDGLSVAYTPTAGFFGADSFTYTISDGKGGLATATVRIAVNPTDPSAPRPEPDEVTVPRDSGGTTIAVLANDLSPLGLPLTILSVTQPANGTVTISPDGLSVIYTPNAGFSGIDPFTYTVGDGTGRTGSSFVTVTVLGQNVIGTSGQNQVGFYAIGRATADGGRVDLFDPAGNLVASYGPFGFGSAAVRVAVGDVTGDGIPDIVVGTGPGVPTQVVVIDGATGLQIAAIQPFEAGFTGGVFVAVGDIDGDGIADIIITPDQGGGPRARIFSGALGDLIADFFVIDDPDFRGGVRPIFADLDGDGIADILAAAGFLGGPRVALWNGALVAAGVTGEAGKFTPDFFVFEQTLRDGVFLTGGDITGDGSDDLIVGGGPGGAPRVFALSGAGLIRGEFTQLANFFAGDPADRSGVRVTAKRIDDDPFADLVVTSGTGANSRVTVYRGASITPDGNPEEIQDFSPLTESVGGLFVG